MQQEPKDILFLKYNTIKKNTRYRHMLYQSNMYSLKAYKPKTKSIPTAPNDLVKF